MSFANSSAATLHAWLEGSASINDSDDDSSEILGDAAGADVAGTDRAAEAGNGSDDAVLIGDAALDGRPSRTTWPEKLAELRTLVRWIIGYEFEGSLVALAHTIAWNRSTLERFLSGKNSSGQPQCPTNLRKTYSSLMEDLWRSNLPTAIPPAVNSTSASPSTSGQHATTSTSHQSTAPAAATTSVTPSRLPVAPIFTVRLQEIEGCKDGGQAVILSIGTPPADPCDCRWQLDCLRPPRSLSLFGWGCVGAAPLPRARWRGAHTSG